MFLIDSSWPIFGNEAQSYREKINECWHRTVKYVWSAAGLNEPVPVFFDSFDSAIFHFLCEVY